MKKKYTKRQIAEAIAYWKKQLKLGNYKKLNESEDQKELKKFKIRYSVTIDFGPKDHMTGKKTYHEDIIEAPDADTALETYMSQPYDDSMTPNRTGWSQDIHYRHHLLGVEEVKN